MVMAAKEPVGVFDSGVGGISVLGALRRELPGEDFLYYGDTANAPYGTKPAEQVMDCVQRVVRLMLGRGIKALVIACNTATAVAAARLRQELSIPVIGMEPALKPAHEMRRGGSILVLATPVTLRLPKFAALMEKYGEGAIPVPCPGLMELVEAERLDEAARCAAERIAGSGAEQVDAVVLGCTHYVFLRERLRRLLPETTALVDGNLGTARQLRRVLAERSLLNPAAQGRCELLTSGDEAAVLPVMRRLMSAWEKEMENCEEV